MTRRAYCPHEERYPLDIVSYPMGTDRVGILCDPFGEPTWRYEDGTRGVSDTERDLARDDDAAMCRSCGAEVEWHDAPRAVVALVVEIDAADVNESWAKLAETPGALFASSPLAASDSDVDLPGFDVTVQTANGALRRTFEID